MATKKVTPKQPAGGETESKKQGAATRVSKRATRVSKRATRVTKRTAKRT